MTVVLARPSHVPTVRTVSCQYYLEYLEILCIYKGKYLPITVKTSC